MKQERGAAPQGTDENEMQWQLELSPEVPAGILACLGSIPASPQRQKNALNNELTSVWVFGPLRLEFQRINQAGTHREL